MGKTIDHHKALKERGVCRASALGNASYPCFSNPGLKPGRSRAILVRQATRTGMHAGSPDVLNRGIWVKIPGGAATVKRKRKGLPRALPLQEQSFPEVRKPARTAKTRLLCRTRNRGTRSKYGAAWLCHARPLFFFVRFPMAERLNKERRDV